jgi:hypothetical protein
MDDMFIEILEQPNEETSNSECDYHVRYELRVPTTLVVRRLLLYHALGQIV